MCPSWTHPFSVILLRVFLFSGSLLEHKCPEFVQLRFDGVHHLKSHKCHVHFVTPLPSCRSRQAQHPHQIGFLGFSLFIPEIWMFCKRNLLYQPCRNKSNYRRIKTIILRDFLTMLLNYGLFLLFKEEHLPSFPSDYRLLF